MPEPDHLLAEVHPGHRDFLALVAEVRPDLHRYCARMMGSVADGEDLVQDALARACSAIAEKQPVPELRPWLFRIAHSRAIDRLRSYDTKMREPLGPALEEAIDPAPDPEDALAREQALQAALSRFLQIAPAQRSAVILKDVLGHSLEEIGALLELSIPAVKAALHRGRARLKESTNSIESVDISNSSRPDALVARYAALFNARDWDAVRAMLADEVRMELVSRTRKQGRRDVAQYFTNYNAIADWRLQPMRLDGREVIAVFHKPGDSRPGYFVELTIENGAVALIRDFRYVPYIARDARFG